MPQPKPPAPKPKPEPDLLQTRLNRLVKRVDDHDNKLNQLAVVRNQLEQLKRYISRQNFVRHEDARRQWVTRSEAGKIAGDATRDRVNLKGWSDMAQAAGYSSPLALASAVAAWLALRGRNKNNANGNTNGQAGGNGRPAAPFPEDTNQPVETDPNKEPAIHHEPNEGCKRRQQQPEKINRDRPGYRIYAEQLSDVYNSDSNRDALWDQHRGRLYEEEIDQLTRAQDDGLARVARDVQRRVEENLSRIFTKGAQRTAL